MLARSDLVGSYVRIGDLLAAAGEHKGASVEYRRALPILAALVAKDPGNTNTEADRAGVLARLADADTLMGRPSDAVTAFAPVVQAFEALLQVDPKNMESQYDLAASLLGQGRALAGQASSTHSPETWRLARASYTRSLGLWRGLEGQQVRGGRLEVGSPAENVRVAQAGVVRCVEGLQPPGSR